jgi:phosphodiesterase/alkaline phosphatase D-like protein
MNGEGAGKEISRRKVLTAAGLAAVAVPLATAGQAKAASLLRRADIAGAPGPRGLHVQFGADASSQAVVSWLTATEVFAPRLRLGRVDTGHGPEVQADERVCTEALSGQTVFTYHARLDRLQPDTQYIYEVLSDGAAPVAGTFRTGPAGRSRGFRFTASATRRSR